MLWTGDFFSMLADMQLMVRYQGQHVRSNDNPMARRIGFQGLPDGYEWEIPLTRIKDCIQDERQLWQETILELIKTAAGREILARKIGDIDLGPYTPKKPLPPPPIKDVWERLEEDDI